jgi:hypothetical protein
VKRRSLAAARDDGPKAADIASAAKDPLSKYHDVVTIDDVLIEYQRRLGEAQAGIAQARMHSISAGVILALAVALLLTLGVYAVRNQISLWWPSLPVPVAAASARLYRRNRESGTLLWRVKRFCDRAIQRVQGEWAGKGETGEQFDDHEHAYAHDLGIFGRGSLFELLCISRTSVGKRGLANYLTEPPAADETLARQRAVGELREQTSLREKIATLGPFEFSDSRWEVIQEWLDAPPVRFHVALRMALLLSSSLLAVIILATAVGPLPWMQALLWGFPLIAFHGALGWAMRRRVRPMIASMERLSVDMPVIREGLRIIEEREFESPKLRHLTKQARGSARTIRKLERMLNALTERKKDWFYSPSLVLMIGTQVCMSVEQWRIRNGPDLRRWLAAWAEFEALNALACYAYENPDNTFAQVTEGEARLEARGLGHPLMARGGCVRNDVELNGAARFYVVSGSNMSGKSTLLRAMGLNAVLALAGSTVRADVFRISTVAIRASISVVDSLLHGKSKFMAEVDRLRLAIEQSGRGPVLFLIDEILSGTNSRDRRIAAEAVVRTLIERGAIGALSTHDLALTGIANEAQLQGVNLHMGSKDGGDPMDFDFRLKPGVSTESNALSIARMAGVPV